LIKPNSGIAACINAGIPGFQHSHHSSQNKLTSFSFFLMEEPYFMEQINCSLNKAAAKGVRSFDYEQQSLSEEGRRSTCIGD
jgi:hypothetical protein